LVWDARMQQASNRTLQWCRVTRGPSRHASVASRSERQAAKEKQRFFFQSGSGRRRRGRGRGCGGGCKLAEAAAAGAGGCVGASARDNNTLGCVSGTFPSPTPTPYAFWIHLHLSGSIWLHLAPSLWLHLHLWSCCSPDGAVFQLSLRGHYAYGHQQYGQQRHGLMQHQHRTLVNLACAPCGPPPSGCARQLPTVQIPRCPACPFHWPPHPPARHRLLAHRSRRRPPPPPPTSSSERADCSADCTSCSSERADCSADYTSCRSACVRVCACG
jgi:hypothetical protein